MSYSERVLYDRYSVKDPEAELKEGDIVVVTQEEKDPFTGKKRDVRLVGIIRAKNGQGFDVTLKHSAENDNEREVLTEVPRHLLEYVVERDYEPVCIRMSEGIVELEEEKEEFKAVVYKATSSMEFIPAGRILAGLGLDKSYDVTLFNCYVFAIPGDSRDGIGKHWLRLLNTYATGGGVGWNISVLRPRGSIVKKVNGRSSGAVSWAEQFSQVTGVVEQGGCFGPSTLLSTTEGLIRADVLANRIDEGDILYAQTHKGPSRIVKAFRNGRKHLYRVETLRGYTVEVSKDHKMGILREGEITTTPLKKLQEGDDTLLLVSQRWREDKNVQTYDCPSLKQVEYERSVMSTNLNEDIIFPTTMTPDLAYFLGYSYGDGYVLRGKKVTWVGDKGLSLAVPEDRPEIVHLLLDCINATFGLHAGVEQGDGACINVKVFSRLIIEWLRQNGLLKQKSESLEFPDYFFAVSRKLAGAFVSGYFDADGSDRKTKGGYGFDSVSKQMLQRLQILLSSFGIPSRIGKQDRSDVGWRDLYRLSVTGTVFKQRMSKFLWMSTKDEKVLNQKQDNSHYPIEVFSARKPLSKYYAGAVATSGPYVSYSAMCRVRDRLVEGDALDQAKEYEEVLQVLPDEIITIEPLKVSEVYDFEVADAHMLSGNGFYTSNSRRGAGLQGLWCWHPDIEEFIETKSLYEKGKTKKGEWIDVHGKLLSNSNVSVMISDDFMEAVQYNDDWNLVFPDTQHPDYDETWDGDLWKWQKEEKPIKVYRTVKAKELWDKIILHAWRSGEPGLLFLERFNKMSNSYYYDRIVCTNPCGEVGLSPNGVCNLGHVNLAKFVLDSAPQFPDTEISAQEANELVNWDRLAYIIHLGVRFLDNCIDLNKYHDDLVKKQQMKERRIGLGILGFGELLMKLGLGYGSHQGLKFTNKLFEFISTESYLASVELAKERGPFPAFDAEKFVQSGFMRKHLPEVIEAVREYGVRNVTLNTIAPTGSISILADTTTGIEPYFALKWTATTRIGTAKEKMSVLETIIKKFGEDAKDWPSYIVTAQRGITTAQHVKTQAVAQRWIDSSISKCIAAGTLIPTDKGLIPVEAFADTHEIDTFVPTDGEFRTGGHRILSHYRAGQKPATRIRLDNGAELVGATESHRVFTPEGLRLMADLKSGDIVVGRFQEAHGKGGMPLEWTDNLRTNANAVKTPKYMTPTFAQFLGMIAADGSTTETTGRVGITCKNDHVATTFRKICQEIFGVLPKEVVDTRNDVLSLYLTSRNLVRFVESLISRGAYNKHAPTAVLQGSYDEKLAFLKGATLDGYITPHGLVVYEGMSKDLAYHLAEIARSFGMPRVNQGSKWVAASSAYTYSVTVSNEMQEIIVPIEPHKQRTATYKRFKVLADVHKIERSKFDSRSTEYYALRTAQNRDNSYVCNTTAKTLGIPADTPVHRVTKVEDAGVVEMYDVEVEDAHEYVVNGMVSHNTVNLPAGSTADDVSAAYIAMWRQGCKGGTVYVDQSRDEQVLYVEEEEKKDEIEVVSVVDHLPAIDGLRPALESGIGPTFSIHMPVGGSVHITFRCDPWTGEPYDFFINAGKGEVAANAQAIARLISMILRWPNNKSIAQKIRLDMIREQLHKIPGQSQYGIGPNAVLSFPDAVAQALDKFLQGDYPLSTLPLGAAQLKKLLEALTEYKVPTEVLNKWFSLEQAGKDVFTQVEEDPKVEEDTSRYHRDICPRCNDLGWLQIPGKCPRCQICGYKEC